MEGMTKTRSRLLLGLFVALVCFFGFRLYRLQVAEAKGSTGNMTTYTTMTRVKAARGEILDRNGNVLVGNRASYDLVLNHYVLISAEGNNEYILSLVKLCQEMGATYTEHFPMTMEQPFTYTLEEQNATWQKYFRTYLQNCGNWDSDITAPLLLQKLRGYYDIPEDWSDEDARQVIGIRYELTLRNHQPNLPLYIFMTDAADDVRNAILNLNIPGMRVEAATVREYHTTYAAHVLGYVGAMSPEQWEEYKEKGYDQDAVVGQTGFELAFEDYLHAQDGWRVDTVTADGTLLRSYFKEEPKAGSNVEVTLDLSLQTVAEDALDARLKDLRQIEWIKDAAGASVVIMNVKTGEVLACASNPTYDPAKLLEDYEEISQQDFGPLNNRALQFAYPSGSVYKMSMVVAAINSGMIKKDTEIYDQGEFTKYAGFSPACLLWTREHETHGSINAEMALCVSCNYFFYELADNMPLEVMDSTAKGFGLGEPTGVELPERIGYRANRETKALLHTGEEARWLQGDKILSGIGQSDNRFTPMQLCVYTSTLANKGVRYKATFLSRVMSTDYHSLILENQPVIVNRMEISKEAYEAYSTGMKMVAHAHPGTASTTFISYPIRVACKTGTAQTGNSSKPDNGAFVCYAPLNDPEIAIAIYGEQIGTGGYLATVAKAILDSYFSGRMDDDGLLETPDVQITYENQVS